MNIYVGNLSYDVDEDMLKDYFGRHGDVSFARVITDRETGRSKGFGFVEMPDDSQAQEAINATNGQEWEGRPLKVNEARPREERPPRDDRPRFGGRDDGHRGAPRKKTFRKFDR